MSEPVEKGDPSDLGPAPTLPGGGDAQRLSSASLQELRREAKLAKQAAQKAKRAAHNAGQAMQKALLVEQQEAEPDASGSRASSPARLPAAVSLDAAPPKGSVIQRAPNQSHVEVRRKRRNALYLRLVVGIVLPTLLSIYYYGFVASDRYESTSLFNIQAVDARQSAGMDSLLGALPGASPTGRDTLTVRDYILSRTVLQRLQEDHQFITHYKNPKYDYVSRLAADASFEDAYEYYEDIVQLDFDTSSGVLTLTVSAYTAEAAQKFALAILHYSEEGVNKLSARSREDQTLFADKEVKLAEDRLEKARQKVLELQAERGEFSPESSAAEALSVRQTLEITLANAKAELMAARAYMAKTAPQVIALQQRVNALASQIKSESKRLVDPKKGGLNTSMVEFESAIFEKEIAQAGYQSAIVSLEMARQEAARQHRYLVTVAAPSLADESTQPHRIAGIFTVLAACALLLGIGTLLTAAIREHAKI